MPRNLSTIVGDITLTGQKLRDLEWKIFDITSRNYVRRPPPGTLETLKQQQQELKDQLELLHEEHYQLTKK